MGVNLLENRRRLIAMQPEIGTETAGGSIVSFDGVNASLKSCVAGIEAVQAGSGTPGPENIRPITGWTGAKVTRTGKNLICKILGNTNVNASGVIVAHTSYTNVCARVESGVTYTISSNGAAVTPAVFSYFDIEPAVGSQTYNASRTVSDQPTFTAEHTGYVCIRLNNADVTDFLQVETGSTPTAYEPYTGQTVDVQFPTFGKNLFDVSTPISRSQYVNGAIEPINNARIMTDYIPVKYGATYTMSIDPTTDNLAFINYNLFDENKNWLCDRAGNGESVSFSGQTEHSFTVNYSGAEYIRIVIRDKTSSSTNIGDKTLENSNLQLELGSTATAYEPYTGTVGSGTLDVLTGTLTMNSAMVDLGTLDWSKGTYTFYCDEQPMPIKKSPNMNVVPNVICSRYETVAFKMVSSGGMDNAISVATGAAHRINIRDTSYTSSADFKAAMSGVRCVYELAEPQVFHLTPTEIRSVFGTNSIWADTGDIEVSWRTCGWPAKATGGIAQFTAVPEPLKALTVNLGYKSGGWSQVNVTRCGKNLLEMSRCHTGYIKGDGSIYPYSDPYEFVAHQIPVLVGERLTMSANQTIGVSYGRYAMTGGYAGAVSGGQVTSMTTNAEANDYQLRFNVTPKPNTEHASLDDYLAIEPQVETGTQATAYEAYHGDTWTVTLPAGMYGGTVDLISGQVAILYAQDGTPLAEPVMSSITPQPVTALQGLNSVYCDSGSVTVRYWMH